VFTGLVEDLGTVAGVDATHEGVRLTVRTALSGELAEGDSIAVNGVCLTATAIADGAFRADVMHETLHRSSLAAAAEGAPVNLELALRADGRLGGHIMQGHVDGVGEVAGVREDGFARVVTIAAGADLLRYVVEKGSIAVDGVSLTVARVDDAGFDVSLIPETLERTTLGVAQPGTPVNLEVDVMAKYAERLLRPAPLHPAPGAPDAVGSSSQGDELPGLAGASRRGPGGRA
jgi:riboflavin synthase